jgi:MFS transporter, SP family, general alpha glucoside:H+ symporter
MGLGFLSVGVVGSCLSWTLLAYFGRRTIYNGGLALLACLQLLIGILDCIPNKKAKPGVVWAEASILIVWNFFYNLTIGPVGFSILCETSAAHVREKTIAFATAVQAFVGIGMTVAVPYMINPDQANLQGKMGFFFGGLASLSFVWAYFRVPETVCLTLLILFCQRPLLTTDCIEESNIRRTGYHVRSGCDCEKFQKLSHCSVEAVA